VALIFVVDTPGTNMLQQDTGFLSKQFMKVYRIREVQEKSALVSMAGFLWQRSNVMHAHWTAGTVAAKDKQLPKQNKK
jgi:hypothetical protein